LVAKGGERAAVVLVLLAKGFVLSLQLMIGFQRIAGVRIDVQVQNRLVECKVHGAKLIHDALAGGVVCGVTSVTPAPTPTPAFALLVCRLCDVDCGNGTRMLAVTIPRIKGGRGASAETASASAGGVCSAVHTAVGGCTAIHGTAEGGTVVFRMAASAIEAVVLIHHDRLLSAR